VTVNQEILSKLDQGRREFLVLVEEIRPDLHRYCARMTGSIADGEDVVQDWQLQPGRRQKKSERHRAAP
jgi:DNA-directed RNA polymerase specialized sigma24 family protein